jgi:hypothetical protein
VGPCSACDGAVFRRLGEGDGRAMKALEIIGVVTPLGAAGYGERRRLVDAGRIIALQPRLPPLGAVRVRLAQAPHWREYDTGLGRWEGSLLMVRVGALADEQLAFFGVAQQIDSAPAPWAAAQPRSCSRLFGGDSCHAPQVKFATGID